ncbi:LuxR C-terminal-related transcriptional regulator [Arthrobacter sp. TMN-49]
MKWGFVARGANVGEIVELLTDSTSRGVLIVGSRGAGKTWILGQLLAALGPDVVTIRLSASKSLAAIPFGAVNARVGTSVVRSNDYYEVLNGLLDQIQTSAKSASQVLLMVDNAEHLDAQSTAIILQVVMSSSAKMILVDQHGDHQSHLRELWRDGHLSRFELAPLKPEDVQDFLEGLLGGKVARPSADYLTSRSGGNPLVLNGLVAGAQEEGSLRQVNNVWILDHPGDRLGSESWEYLQMDLNHLPAQSRRIIEILALAGPLPLDVLLDLTSPEAVDDIQQRELVVIVPGACLTMCLARAATAPPIRAAVPMGSSRRLLAEVSKFFPLAEQADPESVINSTRWSLDCGVPVSDGRILAAATWANQLMRPLEALQFCAIKVGAEHAVALLAQHSIASLNQNLPDRARTLALQAFQLATTPEVAASALRAVHLSHLSDLNYEATFDGALKRFESRFSPVPLHASASRADIEVLILRASKDVAVGDTERARASIEALLRHPLTDNLSDQVTLKSLLCEILSATGRMRSAVLMATEVIADLDHPDGFPRPDLALLAYARSVAALIYDGAWDHARGALEPSTFVNPDLMLFSGGLRDLAAALMHCRRGHIEEAIIALGAAVGALTDYDPWSVLHTALGLLAYCLAMRGDTVGAQERLAQLASLNRRSNKFYYLEGAAYAAAAQFMAGQSELGLARLRHLQRQCVSENYLGIELTVLSLMVRLGDGGAVLRLVEVAALLESGSKEFFEEWSRALRTQEPAGLDKASNMAMNYGFELIAVELASQAQKKFNDSGKVHKSRKTASKVVAMREQMPGLASPVFQTIDQPQLTRREHQIALLVAQRQSNNSIAARLNVSLRTIEGHLYRTFIKLDIQSREQLAARMNGGLEVAEQDSGTYYS